MRKKKINNNNSLRKRVFGFSFLLLLVLVFFLKMYTSFKVDLLMKDLHALEQHKKQLVSETENLISEVSRLQNIDYISKLASEKHQLINNTDKIVALKLSDFDEMNKLKQEFGKRNQESEKVYKLAGVH